MPRLKNLRKIEREMDQELDRQVILASGREVAFRPYGKPDSPPAKEFAKNWKEVTGMVMRRLAMDRRKK